MSIVLFYFLCHATLTFHQLFYIQLFDMLKLIEIELSNIFRLSGQFHLKIQNFGI